MKLMPDLAGGLGQHRAQEVARAVGLERRQQPQRAVAVDGVPAPGRDQQVLAHLELGQDVGAVGAAADVPVDRLGERDVVRGPGPDVPGAVTSRGLPFARTAGCSSSPSRW